MKADQLDTGVLESLRMRPEMPGVLAAFDRLADYGIESTGFDCVTNPARAAKELRFRSRNPPGWPFSLSASSTHAVFVVRPLGSRTLAVTKASLERIFPTVRRRRDGGMEIAVSTLRDSDAIVEHLLARWPASPAPEQGSELTGAREGLGRFRENVERIEGACRATGVMDRRHLRAVHIKSWLACGDAEKFDGNNGLLLSPHVAHLFERGYISFTDDGRMLVARQLNSTVLKRWAIALPVFARAFVAKQRPYLAWHREHVFEKVESGRRRKG